ncbi:hypothetical protein BX666DRAFT_2117182 [Dichotomocladium elegans]|nr:hypothetical protein BX666DRAFT_2117182 [Dichotomocladium elegans]
MIVFGLVSYVKDTDHPIFSDFVAANMLDIARWSINYAMKALDLFAIKKYDPNAWQWIEKSSEAPSEASLAIRIEALKAMIAAVPSASNSLKEVLNSQEDEQQQQQQQQQTQEATHRLLLHESDAIDVAIAKLGISRIRNVMNPSIRKIILNNLNDNAKQVVSLKAVEAPVSSLNLDVCMMIDSIIKHDGSGESEDVDEILARIQTKKAECSETNNEIHSYIKL